MIARGMIDVFCPYFGTGGMWRHARSFVAALRSYRRTALYPWERPRDEDVPADIAALLGRPHSRDHTALGIGPIVEMARRISYARMPERFGLMSPWSRPEGR